MGEIGWPAVFLIVLAVLLVVGLVLFTRRSGGKQRSKSRMSGFGMSVEAEASSEVTPGIRVNEATSRAGGLTAEDKTGRGIHAGKLDTKADINLTNTPIGDVDPKP